MFKVGKTAGSSVIENARAARQERANQRLQEHAASVIQCNVKGYLTRIQIYKQWRREIDDVIGWEECDTSCLTHENDSKTQEPSSSTLDKINPSNKNLSTQQWQFASFGSNTLTGVYRNFSNVQPKTSESEDKTSSSESASDSAISSQSSLSKEKTCTTLCKETVSATNIHLNAKVDATELFYAIKKLLVVFNKRKDKARFQHLCRFLLYNVQNHASLKISYVALSLNKTLALKWILQVKRVLWIVCQYIQDYTESTAGKKTELPNNSLLFHMLTAFTDISDWKVMQKQTALHTPLRLICSNIICDIQNKGCMRVVGSVLVKDITNMKPDCLHHCFTILMRQVISSKCSEASIKSFAVDVLTVPSLFWHLENKASKCFASFTQSNILTSIVTSYHVGSTCPRDCGGGDDSVHSDCVIRVLCMLANIVQMLGVQPEVLDANNKQAVRLLNGLINYLYVNTTQQKSSTSTWHPVLGYFSQTGIEYSDSMSFVKMQLEYLWKPEFFRSIFRDVLSLESLHDATSLPIQAEQIIAKGSAEKHQKFFRRFFMCKLKGRKVHHQQLHRADDIKVGEPSVTTKMSSYLKRMISSRPEQILLPTGGRKLEYEEVKSACNACLLYRKALAIFTHQLQLEMLTGLTFMDDVLCRLWRFICELGQSGGLQLFLSALSYPPDVAEPYFAVFTLFCDMTSHILSILDDVEFYEQQVPFHLEELLTISAFLRQFVFKVIWNKLVTDWESPMYSVFDSSHTLLMMLYDRDARRAFTPPNHWLCKTVKSSTIRNELDAGSPRAGLLLRKIPFVIPHKDRVIYFRSLVAANKNALGLVHDTDVAVYIRVHRSRLVADGFEQLNNLPTQALKGTIRVKFVNDLGLDEAGIDQDGVFKEFLEEIVRKVFNPDMNLFRVTNGEEAKLYPSPLSHIQDDHLTLFNFVGRILGKAVYEGIVLDIPFANFFLRHLLGHQNVALYSPIDELPSLDSEFYKNLTWVKRYEGDIGDLGLTFTYEEDVMGKIESRELIPGGSSTMVTNENRFMYIHTLAHYRLHTQIKQQTRAFVQGFRSLIPSTWTAMFSAPELQRLISGDNVDMDLTDLKSNVMYYGGFHSSHRLIKWLWDILERDYTARERAAFLKFVTSCSRPPLLGFAHLQPQFSIRCVEVPDDEDTGDTVATVLRGFLRLPSTWQSSKKGRGSQQHRHRLPTASTCFNLLKLPNYPNKDVLREKLKQAICNNTGFELS